MRISDWSSDVCSSDLSNARQQGRAHNREETKMKATKWIAALVMGASLAGVAYAASAQEQVIPSMVYRTGPYAPSGIPVADGFSDYVNLINERDGGLNGVKLRVEECETRSEEHTSELQSLIRITFAVL